MLLCTVWLVAGLAFYSYIKHTGKQKMDDVIKPAKPLMFDTPDSKLKRASGYLEDAQHLAGIAAKLAFEADVGAVMVLVRDAVALLDIAKHLADAAQLEPTPDVPEDQRDTTKMAAKVPRA